MPAVAARWLEESAGVWCRENREGFMRTKRTARRFVLAADGIIVVASAAGAVSAAALARTGGSHAARTAATHQACRAAALRLRLAGTDTGAGSTALTVMIANRSAAACSLRGYPELRLARPDGSAAPARIGPGRGPLFAGMSPREVRLRPGGRASFFLLYRDFNPRTGRPGSGQRLGAVQRAVLRRTPPTTSGASL
jgi:Protein of unknown function (DUF4232)